MEDRFGALTPPEQIAGNHYVQASVSFLAERRNLTDDASVDHLTLIALLAQGLTDEAIARRLGTSSRTVRRRVADIVHILGAKSRFQAGALAVEAGWLSPLVTQDVS